MFVCNLQLIPKHQWKYGVRSEAKQRGTPSLIEAPKTLGRVYSQKTVHDASIQNSTSAGIGRLVVKTRWYNVKWSHEYDDNDTAQHAGSKRLEPAVVGKYLHVQTHTKTIEIQQKIIVPPPHLPYHYFRNAGDSRLSNFIFFKVEEISSKKNV
jgi:hypothetical protein